jgi:hypothetical protein
VSGLATIFMFGGLVIEDQQNGRHVISACGWPKDEFTYQSKKRMVKWSSIFQLFLLPSSWACGKVLGLFFPGCKSVRIAGVFVEILQ